MTTLQILIAILGTVSAVTLLALGWAFMAIAGLHDKIDNLPCCDRPDTVDREWEGQVRPFCMNCGLYSSSPMTSERRAESSPGTKDEGELERPTEGRSDAA